MGKKRRIYGDGDITIQRVDSKNDAIIKIDSGNGEIPHEMRIYNRHSPIRGDAIFELISVRRGNLLQLYCRETVSRSTGTEVAVARKESLALISEYEEEVGEFENNLLEPDGYDLKGVRIIPGPLLEYYLNKADEAEGGQYS